MVLGRYYFSQTKFHGMSFSNSSLGISLILSSVTVYFRDLQHFIGVLLQLFFYATPILYSVESLPENFRWILRYNPMTYIIGGYRDIFYSQSMPDVKMQMYHMHTAQPYPCTHEV